jgi:hypothetical protein
VALSDDVSGNSLNRIIRCPIMHNSDASMNNLVGGAHQPIILKGKKE